MKKIIVSAFVILLVWNIILTLTVIDLNNRKSETVKDNSSTIKQLSTEFETDYTDLIDFVKEKVVLVSNNGKMVNGIIYGKSEDNALYVITKASFITNTDEIYVEFANHEKVEAGFVGQDIYSDVALLKIGTEFNVDTFVLGDSSVVKAGEYALTISARPYDGAFSYYSSCMISGKGRISSRDLDGDGNYDYDLPLVQIDDKIDANSTCAALVNMNGELIGVVTTSISTASNESVAIGVNEIKYIVDGIINLNLKRVNQDVFVTDIRDVPLYLRSYYNIPFDIENGVVVMTVNQPESEFVVGDVITNIDSTDINNNKEYREFVYKSETESHVYTVNRNGETVVITVE